MSVRRMRIGEPTKIDESTVGKMVMFMPARNWAMNIVRLWQSGQLVYTYVNGKMTRGEFVIHSIEKSEYTTRMNGDENCAILREVCVFGGDECTE